MPALRLVLLALLLASGTVCTVQASLVWRPGEGWSDESGGEISASSSRDQLDLAHKLEAEGHRDDALKAYKGLLRKWPLSLLAPEAQYRAGKIQEDLAAFTDAFASFQKMVQKYPSSDYFPQALEEQYRIANLFLAGEPQHIWKIPVGPSMDKTVEMYEKVIKNAPYGNYAPQCQFNIGLAREKQRRYSDAIDAYQDVIDKYPTSDVAANAQYQIGYAWMVSASSAAYDQSSARKAIDAFQDFLVRYPESDKAAQAQDNILSLSSRQTQGALNIAQFYEKQHDPRAAFIYYNEVVREDPNSAQAQRAKKRIQELRPAVEALPGGLGPDGSGNLATIASGPAAPLDATPSAAPALPATPPAPGSSNKPDVPTDASRGVSHDPTTLPGDPTEPGSAAATPTSNTTPGPTATPASNSPPPADLPVKSADAPPLPQ